MNNTYLSGTYNKYRNKIKGDTKTNCSVTPNTKITQYLERTKINNYHKTPPNILNKSQNIKENQKISKVNLKNLIINNKMNYKNNNYINKSKQHNRKSNSINPSRNNYSLKLNSMNNLPGCYINNYNHNHNNKNLSKNNSSLSYYYSSNNNTTNNKNKNTKISKANFRLKCVKANLSNFANFYYKKVKKPQKKSNVDVNLTTDITNYRKINTSSFNYFITEESKKEIKETKNRNKLKMSYLSLNKKNKKNNGKVSLLSNIKPNIPLKITQKNTQHLHPSSIGRIANDLSSDKIMPSPPDSTEIKIINDLKTITCDKNSKNNNYGEKIDKLQKIYEEMINYFLPKETQDIFVKVFKEYNYLCNELYNNFIHSEEKKNQLNEKLKNLESKNVMLQKNFNEKEEELNELKEQIKIFFESHKNNYQSEYINDEEDDYIDNYPYQNNKNNCLLAQLNKKNLDDLESIYFFDKVTGKNTIRLNNSGKQNKYNYMDNNGEIVPELNLDPNYIEKCKKKELLKIEEAHLTPFQKIALEFEMS